MHGNIIEIMALVDNQRLKKSDAIILLTGDGFYRVKKAVELYKHKWAEFIVISGGVSNVTYGSFPAIAFERKLLKARIEESKIILEKASQNTWQQAVNVMKLIKNKNWRRIILVASNYHQYRAYLTFIKAMLDAGLMIEIINAPAELAWFKKEKWGRRIDLLDKEFQKIEQYSKNEHIVSFKDLSNYQIWKEKQD